MKYIMVILGVLAGIVLCIPSLPSKTPQIAYIKPTRQSASITKPLYPLVTTSLTSTAIPLKPSTSSITASIVQPSNSTPSDNCAQYEGLVAQYNWDVNTMMAIMQAESGCNPNAVSSTNDYGLLQIHNAAVFDPTANIALAYSIWQRQGYEAWSSWNSGVYAQFL